MAVIDQGGDTLHDRHGPKGSGHPEMASPGATEGPEYASSTLSAVPTEMSRNQYSSAGMQRTELSPGSAVVELLKGSVVCWRAASFAIYSNRHFAGDQNVVKSRQLFSLVKIHLRKWRNGRRASLRS